MSQSLGKSDESYTLDMSGSSADPSLLAADSDTATDYIAYPPASGIGTMPPHCVFPSVDAQAFHIHYLNIPGSVKVNLRTGEVELHEGVDLDEAALEFWKAVQRAFGEFIRDAIEEAMLEAL